MSAALDLPRRIAEAARSAGGRALVVGGYVRDELLGLHPKDVDLEVFGLPLEALQRLLSRFGPVDAVGRSFGVLKVQGLDVSVPRRDSKTGAGHRGFLVEPDPSLSFREAARRRDFTMNAIGLDPLTGELLDPYDGRDDLRRRVLKRTDPETFLEDPLRFLRAAQFLARFELSPEPGLVASARARRESLRELPAERLFEEWTKLLLKGRRPSIGLGFLHETGIDEVLFPEVRALAGCPQEAEWHPEGDVFVHTAMALDVAAAMRTGEKEHDLVLMLGVLCHDFGKPATTAFEDGRWRSPAHEHAGIAPTEAFLSRLKAPHGVAAAVAALVADHLAPAHFAKSRPGPKAYRRLARKLGAGGTTIEMLHEVATADHFGRTTPDALARLFPAGDAFLEAARAVAVEKEPEKDVVLGRHLIARGLAPGPGFGPILDRCRDVQDETGLTDPEAILECVLGPGAGAPAA